MVNIIIMSKQQQEKTTTQHGKCSQACYSGGIHKIDELHYAAAGVAFCYLNKELDIEFLLCKQERKEKRSWLEGIKRRISNKKKTP